MTGFRRVVVGIDGSDAAGEALALAQRLADPDGVLVLAHVDAHRAFRLPHGHVREPAAAPLDAARAQVEGDRPVTCVVRAANSAARGLTEIAEDERADLIVLGSHRPAPEGGIAAGRIAARLLHGGPCAVAIAPAGAAERDRFHHVGVAYDASAEAAAALAAAYAVAARDRAAASIYLCIPPIGAGYGGEVGAEIDQAAQAQRVRAQEQLDAAADDAPHGVNPRTVLLRGNPADEIARACDGIVDLLFAGSRGYGPMHRALVGSVSEALARSARHPVVVMPRSVAAGEA